MIKKNHIKLIFGSACVLSGAIFAVDTNSSEAKSWSTYFVTGSATKFIQTPIQKITREAASYLKKSPGAKILLTGHTDATGSVQINETLAKNRAEKIKSLLIAQGVSADSIDIAYEADRSPAADNASPLGRLKNRRVELSLIDSTPSVAAVAPAVVTETTKVESAIEAPRVETIAKVASVPETSFWGRILPWLLGALALGGLVGWMLRGLGLASVLNAEKDHVKRLSASLSNKDQELKVQTQSLNGRIATLTQEIETKNTDALQYTKSISGLESQLSSLRSELQSKEIRLNEYATQVSSFKEVDVSPYAKRIGELENSVKTVDLDLQSKTKRILELEGIHTTIKSDVEGRDRKIKALEDQLSATRSDLAVKAKDLEELKIEAEAALTEKFRTESKVAELSNKLFSAEQEANHKLRSAHVSELFGKKIVQDDLKLVEGIGPKIEELFHNAGIRTWTALAELSVERCREIVMTGGERYRIHDPSTWPAQCKLAASGQFDELKQLQDVLNAGRDSVGPITV